MALRQVFDEVKNLFDNDQSEAPGGGLFMGVGRSLQGVKWFSRVLESEFQDAFETLHFQLHGEVFAAMGMADDVCAGLVHPKNETFALHFLDAGS